jgi:hypothetical protein
MNLYKVFLIALMTSAFAVVGCGDSGQSASEVCNACRVEALRGECEEVFNLCVETGDVGSHEDCAAAGLFACSVEL